MEKRFVNQITRLRVATIRIALLATFVVLLANGNLNAQDRSERRSRFDPVAYLKKLDANRNGSLEPSEVSGRTEDWLKKMGFDTKRPMSMKKILDRLDNERRERDSNRDSRSRSDVSALKVQGFGASDSESAIPGFGLSTVRPLTTNYSEDVERQVEETLGRYDRNGNGMLDRDEVERARWGSPRPQESDSNGDGKLSRIELANRYYAREQYRRSRRDRDDDEDRDDRGQGRERSDRGRRVSSSSSSAKIYSPSGGSRTYSSNRATSSIVSGSTTSRSTGADRAKTESYAAGLMSKYDQDKDGKLNKAEIKEMRRPPLGADSNSDGYVTKDELIDSLSGKRPSRPTASDDRKPSGSSSSKSPTTRARSYRSSGSFEGLDKNEDKRVEMHEFADEWDDEKVAEFYEKDKNGDGVITLKEWSEK